jgi:hypothetical protein
VVEIRSEAMELSSRGSHSCPHACLAEYAPGEAFFHTHFCWHLSDLVSILLYALPKLTLKQYDSRWTGTTLEKTGQCEYDRHAREAKDPAGVAFAWGARLKPSDNNNNKQRVGATLFLVGGSTRPTTSNTSSLGERVFNNYIYLFRFSNDPGHQPKVGCQ